MHVQARPPLTKPPLAAAVIALFAGVIGVAHGADFDEKVKAPQARNAEQLRLVAKVASAEFADASLDRRVDLIRDTARARRQFDARWTVQHAVETRAPLDDLRDFGIVPNADGSVQIDAGRFPQWDAFEGRVAELLGHVSIDSLRTDLVNRGMKEDDVSAMETYLSSHDAAAMRRQAALPIALSFAKVVRKYDRIKKPVPTDVALDYFYQNDAATADAERNWLSGLLDALDPHAARILLSWLGELDSTVHWAPQETETVVRNRLATFRLPDFEQRARTEASGGAK